MARKQAPKFSAPGLDRIAADLAAVDKQLAACLANAERLRQRVADLKAQREALLGEAASASAHGEFSRADAAAHDSAVKTAALAASEAAQAAIVSTLAGLVAEGERLEREAADVIENAFAELAQQLVDDLRADLGERLSRAWSARIRAGGEIASRDWLNVNLGSIFAKIRLLPPGEIAPGAPTARPRSEHVEAARALLADRRPIEDAA